jgi:hypothetical protein
MRFGGTLIKSALPQFSDVVLGNGHPGGGELIFRRTAKLSEPTRRVELDSDPLQSPGINQSLYPNSDIDIILVLKDTHPLHDC